MDRLARFTDVTISDPATFGGGSARGHVRFRVTTVAYGYLGVVEEYENPEGGTVWSLLTVSLPGLAPSLVVDHRSAFGRPGVPAADIDRGTGDGDFDATYAVAADAIENIDNILNEPVRSLLLRNQVQRLQLSGTELLLRTFDGSDASEQVIGWLSETVEGILSSTPSFVTPRSGRDVGLRGRPLAPGLHGAGDPPDEEPERPERARHAGRTRLGGLIAGRAPHHPDR